MTCAPNIYTHIYYFYSTQNKSLIDIFYRIIIVIANTVLYIYIHVHVSIYAVLYIHCTRIFFPSKIQQQSKTSVIRCTLLHTLVT